MGRMTEAAVFSQHFAAGDELHYARWKERGGEGEVDFGRLGPDGKPEQAVEVKWSDRFAEKPQELEGLIEFARRHPRAPITLTTRSVGPASLDWPGPGKLQVVPTSFYCLGEGFAESGRGGQEAEREEVRALTTTDCLDLANDEIVEKAWRR